MTAAVVADRPLLVSRQRGQVGDDLLDRLVGPLGALQRGVDLVHVGLMVLVVVHAHRRLVDARFQCVVVVGKIRDGIRHRVTAPLLCGVSVAQHRTYRVGGVVSGVVSGGRVPDDKYATGAMTLLSGY